MRDHTSRYWMVCCIWLVSCGLLGCGGQDRYEVSTESMSPTLAAGQVIYVDREAYTQPSEVQRWEIVLVDIPETSGPIARRVVGLPGEQISYDGDRLLVNGHPLDVPDTLGAIYGGPIPSPSFPGAQDNWSSVLSEQEVFVLGDNLQMATDSRYYGPINFPHLLGKVRD
ncbi:MAG: signal peptidase I [Phycisphaeraceae bacterium]